MALLGEHAGPTVEWLDQRFDELDKLLSALGVIGGLPAEVLQRVQGLGEVCSAQLLGEYLRTLGEDCAVLDARDVLVVDRATARSTKRSLFGMALPRIKLFGDNDDEEIEQIESSIASAYDAKDGLSVFVLADGARWKQTEGRYTFPKAGQPIVIRRAALGSFFAKVDNQAAVRVIRLPQGQ